MEISKMLTISTAHIMERTGNELNEAINNAEAAIDLCIYEKKDYGFYVHIPEDWQDERNIPCDLKDCVKMADNNGCEWLCLDRDGEIVGELPVYEWTDGASSI